MLLPRGMGTAEGHAPPGEASSRATYGPTPASPGDDSNLRPDLVRVLRGTFPSSPRHHLAPTVPQSLAVSGGTLAK